METKFTPGPWKSLGAESNFCIEVIKDNGGSLAVSNNWICSTHQQFSSRKTGEANARLIAASPTMFDYINKKAEAGDLEAQNIIKELI